MDITTLKNECKNDSVLQHLIFLYHSENKRFDEDIKKYGSAEEAAKFTNSEQQATNIYYEIRGYCISKTHDLDYGVYLADTLLNLV